MTPPPPGTSARVLLLREEEKLNNLLINTFPSFPRRGVICHQADDGVVKLLLIQPLFNYTPKSPFGKLRAGPRGTLCFVNPARPPLGGLGGKKMYICTYFHSFLLITWNHSYLHPVKKENTKSRSCCPKLVFQDRKS